MKKTMHFLRFIFDRFSKKMKLHYSLVLLTTILSSVVIIFIPLMQKEIISSVIDGEIIVTNIITFGIIAIVFSFLIVFESVKLHQLYIDMKNKLEIELLNGVTKDHNSIIDQRGPGAYMVSLFGNSDQIGDLITTNYFKVFTSLITTVIILVIGGSWFIIFPILVVATYIVLFMLLKITNNIYKRNFKLARDLVFEVNPKVLEFIENRNSVMANANSFETENTLKVTLNQRDKYFKKAFVANSFAESSITAIKNLSLLMFFVISVFYIADGRLDISKFVAITAYFSFVFIPISSIQKAQSGLNKFPVLYNRIKGNLYETKDYVFPMSSEIKLENISLDLSDSSILVDLSMTVNERIGLVGLSGEGKSSLIKLIFKDLLPSKGNIYIGEKQNNELSKRMIFAMINYYSQDIEIFDNDLVYNLTLGKRSLSRSEYREKEISIIENYDIIHTGIENYEILKFNMYLKHLLHLEQKSGISYIEKAVLDFDLTFLVKVYMKSNYYIIEKLNGLLDELSLNNLLNRDFGQRGKKVSGGEKNRIAMCRFLLNDLSLPFIIDEPFTSLDVLSEVSNTEILRKYLLSSKGIIISHKMNVMRSLSSSIYVLEEGVVTSIGTHDSLVKEDGIYKKLYDEHTSKMI